MKQLLMGGLLIFVLTFQAKGEVQYLKKPIRNISVIASNEAFYPDNISIFLGESIQFFITTTSDKGSCFYLEKTLFNTSLKLGKIESTQVTFTEPGTYFYYCPTNNIRGKVQVIKSAQDIREEEEQNRAGLKRKREGANWRPTEDAYFKYN